MGRIIATGILLLFCLVAESAAAVLPTGFSESLVASGISSPTAMAFAPDGRLFVCQQGGQLRVIKEGTLLPARGAVHLCRGGRDVSDHRRAVATDVERDQLHIPVVV